MKTRAIPNCLIVATFLMLAVAARAATLPREVAPGVLHVGQFSTNEINESSGIIKSRRGANAYWTHNDGDNSLFSFRRTGQQLGKWNISSRILVDFEDIAWSPGRIYAADIGNNLLDRTNVFVYTVPEPGPTFSGSLPIKNTWRLSYPNNEPFDAESLLVHRGHGYIISKQLVDGTVGMYRFRLGASGRRLLEPQCRLDADSDIGGADMTPDARRLAVITDEGPYLFEFPGSVPATGTIQASYYVPFLFPGMEACCFTRDGLLVTAETGEVFLFTDERFRLPRRAAAR